MCASALSFLDGKICAIQEPSIIIIIVIIIVICVIVSLERPVVVGDSGPVVVSLVRRVTSVGRCYLPLYVNFNGHLLNNFWLPLLRKGRG